MSGTAFKRFDHRQPEMLRTPRKAEPEIDNADSISTIQGSFYAAWPSGGMADARDLKSRGGKPPCGFESRLGYLL